MREVDSVHFNLVRWASLQTEINKNKVDIDRSVFEKSVGEKEKLKEEKALYKANLGLPVHTTKKENILSSFLESRVPKFNIKLGLL